MDGREMERRHAGWGKFLALAPAFALAGCAMFGSGGEDGCEDGADGMPAEHGVEIVADEEFTATNGAVAVSAPVPLPAGCGETRLPVVDAPSPNFDERRLPVDMIVLHYTAAPLKESLRALRDGNARARVSAHYLVAEDGTVYRLVDESMRAWHAGVSRWGGVTDVNSASIGVEIVNLGVGKDGKAQPYPLRQIEAVAALCLEIQRRHDIAAVVGHSDVAPGRKIDPGPLFPWKFLSDRGVNVRRKR